jgi:glycerophosphoryl diester phosphodiesterase
MKRKIALGVVGLLVAAYMVLAWRVAPAPDHAYFTGVERPLVIAHQGGERLYPSNTLLAMQESAALGVDVLEMDIHASSDGVLVSVTRSPYGRYPTDFPEVEPSDYGTRITEYGY